MMFVMYSYLCLRPPNHPYFGSSRFLSLQEHPWESQLMPLLLPRSHRKV